MFGLGVPEIIVIGIIILLIFGATLLQIGFLIRKKEKMP